MATEPIDSVSEIAKRALRVGNDIYSSGNTQNGTTNALPYADSNGKLAASSVTASTPVYIDSSSIPQTGTIPFSIPVARADSTTGTFFDLTGSSTLSETGPLTNTLVAAAAVTTFTVTGYLRIQLTDSGGNITNGRHYIEIGTIT